MKRRTLALLALAACSTTPAPDAPPPKWVYAPPVVAPPIPPGLERGRFGRSQAPERLLAAGVQGEAAPLLRPTVWPVPGIGGPPRAVVQGFLGEVRATELVDVDGGRLLWRDVVTCSGAILGVTDDAIVCADGAGVRALGVDGVARWRHAGPYLAMTEGRVLVGAGDQVTVLEASDGDELARVSLPRGVIAESIVASCGNLGLELYASAPDGALQRIEGGAIAWSVPVGTITSIDACHARSVVVAVSSDPTPGRGSLISIARPTGAVTGRIDGVRGSWEARDDSERFEVATEQGVAVWPRSLIGPPETLALPPLGELIAERGDARLVRATPLTAVVLDRRGVRAYVALGSAGAVLGERAILGATGGGAAGETVHRFGMPVERARRPLRVPRLRAGVALPAELRDLPDTVDLDVSRAIAVPDTAMLGVASAILDPADPHRLYAIALERSRGEPATVAALDLATRSWLWQRSEACGPGAPVALAVGRELLVCAALGDGATLRATTRDGAARWTWHAVDRAGPITTPAQVPDAGSGSATEPVHTFGGGALAIDRVQIAGDTALVHDADRVIVLDARTGAPRGSLSSDDGAPMRAILVALPAADTAAQPLDAETTLLVAYERDRLVARLPGAGLAPVWTLGVDGVVRALSPAGREAFLVELDDGDAYRIDARTLAIVGLPGLNLAWTATGDAVAGATLGGPIPGTPLPPAAAPPRTYFDGAGNPVPPPKADPEMFAQWTPIPPPPPLGDSWQIALFDLGGGLRAANDYGVALPVLAPGPRGPRGSPVVVRYGRGGGEVLVLDPQRGDPLRRVRLPEGAPGFVFGTVVDGAPVAGTLLARPLRAVLF